MKPRISSKRRQFIVGSAAAASTFFVPKSSKAGAKYVMKIGTVAPAGTPWAKHLARIKRKVEKESGGRIDVKSYMGGALGDEIAVAEATKRGSVQVFGGTAAALASAVPELAVIELPYLFPNVKKADHVLDNVIWSELESLLWQRGYKLGFLSENGWRSVGSNFGFVKSPGDFKGKKMRSMESDVHLDTWRAMGASPVPIPVTEVLSGLKTGVVDGFDNTPLFTFAASWYQGITHFTLTRHSYQPGLVVISRKWYESLPKDLQKVVVPEDPEAEAAYGRKGVRAIRSMLIKNFSNAGIKVSDLSSSERAALAKATRKVHSQFAKSTSSKGKRLLRKIKAAV